MADMGGATQSWREANRAHWDERTPIHVESGFYDVDGFRSGQRAVEPFEIDELGPLTGRMAHLQCHFGMDTLDLVRLHPDLRATGLDFSAPAIDAATQLAADIGVGDRARFVAADLYDAVEALSPAHFDVVYTGKGALEWLPDMAAWAEIVAGLLRPGGFLYLVEFHPTAWTLDNDSPTVAYDYFQREPFVSDDAGSYADRTRPTTNNLTYEWVHPISTVVNALVGAGLRLQFFHEWDYTVYAMFPWLVSQGSRRWRCPGPGAVPLMYSLKAFRDR